MNKKLITGTITLAALLSVGASANIGANASSYMGNADNGASYRVNQPIYAEKMNGSSTFAGLRSTGQTSLDKGQTVQAIPFNHMGRDGYVVHMPGDNSTYYVPNNNPTWTENQSNNELQNNTNADSTNSNQSPQYTNSNTLPQTGESKNAKDVALAGLSALAASVALIGADPAKEAVKNKMVNRRLKYGI